jgi:hypothetical protein
VGKIFRGIFPKIFPRKNVRKIGPWWWTKGWTFPLGDKFHPRGPSLHLGARDEAKNGPLVLSRILTLDTYLT